MQIKEYSEKVELVHGGKKKTKEPKAEKAAPPKEAPKAAEKAKPGSRPGTAKSKAKSKAPSGGVSTVLKKMGIGEFCLIATPT